MAGLKVSVSQTLCETSNFVVLVRVSTYEYKLDFCCDAVSLQSFSKRAVLSYALKVQ